MGYFDDQAGDKVENLSFECTFPTFLLARHRLDT